MTDEEFIEELEARRLPEPLFDHAAHVRAGYVYLRRQKFPLAVARMCTAVEGYAASLGRADRYHETVTIGFMALIQEHMKRRGDGDGWEGFKSQNPELLRKDALLAYYPKAILDSDEARVRFILLPLGSIR
jgi:hypothetical protein